MMKEQELDSDYLIGKERFEDILKRIPSLKAGVIGDICLDVYWEAEMGRSELSRETPHYTLPVIAERYSPGAAGNVAANLKAIGCQSVSVCSLVGEDWRGTLLKKVFTELGIDLTYTITSEEWCTPAYCKPIRIGLQNARQEDPRLDFQNYATPQGELEQQLIAKLELMAENVDVIAVTDQFKFGVIGEGVRECLRRLATQGKIILVDSRDRIHLFHGLTIKPNELEAAKCYPDTPQTADRPMSYWAELAMRLSQDMNSDCFMTMGDRGSIFAADGQYTWIPSLPVSPPLDIVGAGDSFASALLASLGAGSEPKEAMSFAHFASSISIKKIGSTGTASPNEMRARYEEHVNGKQETRN